LHFYLVWGVLEIGIIFAHIFFYGLGYGNFFTDGYLFLILDCVFMVVYLRRFMYLSMVKRDFLAGGEQ